jgi:hypothetical protein
MVFHVCASGKMGKNVRQAQGIAADADAKNGHKLPFADKACVVPPLRLTSCVAACFTNERIEVLAPNLSVAGSIAAGS